MIPCFILRLVGQAMQAPVLPSSREDIPKPLASSLPEQLARIGYAAVSYLKGYDFSEGAIRGD